MKKILFVGDIVPGGVLHYQEDYIDSHLMEYMRGFDLRIGTLECAVGNTFEKDINKQRISKPFVYVLDEHLQRIKEMNFNYVSLANNHVFDLGVEGFRNTIAKLEESNINYFGAGVDFEHAKKPAVIDLDDGKKLAIIGCLVNYEKPVVFYYPSKDSPCLNIQNVDEICNDIIEAKKEYDYVVVMPHWGLEHLYFQPEFIRQAAFKMVQAGADAIYGSHPHIINPRVKYKGTDIFFSMGNFLFVDRVVKYPKDIYYPNTEETYTLPRKWSRPYPKTQEPYIAISPAINRVGMMIECDMESTIEAKYKFVHLTHKNILRLFNSPFLRFRLSFMGFLYKFTHYTRIARLANSTRNVLTPICDKISFPSIHLQ